MVSVGTSNSKGYNSKVTITWLVSILVDKFIASVLYPGNGVLSSRQHFSFGISRDKEYKHKVDALNFK